MFDIANTDMNELISYDWLENDYEPEVLLYATELIKGTIDNIKEIDDAVKNTIKNELSLKRMGFIEKAIIRVMGFEILKEKSVPELVIINEAIEIAKKYGNDYSHKFVNGILDEIRKKFTTTEKN